MLVRCSPVRQEALGHGGITWLGMGKMGKLIAF